MDEETYTCDSHLALQHVVSAMTYYLNNSFTKTELDEKVIKAERRKMQLVIETIQKNWADKSVGR